MTRRTDTSRQFERLKQQSDRIEPDATNRAQTTETVCDLATDLEAQVDAYLQSHRDLPSGRREQLRQGTLETALAAVRASLNETPGPKAAEYVEEALRTARETIALLER